MGATWTRAQARDLIKQGYSYSHVLERTGYDLAPKPKVKKEPVARPSKVEVLQERKVLQTRVEKASPTPVVQVAPEGWVFDPVSTETYSKGFWGPQDMPGLWDLGWSGCLHEECEHTVQQVADDTNLIVGYIADRDAARAPEPLDVPDPVDDEPELVVQIIEAESVAPRRVTKSTHDPDKQKKPPILNDERAFKAKTTITLLSEAEKANRARVERIISERRLDGDFVDWEMIDPRSTAVFLCDLFAKGLPRGARFTFSERVVGLHGIDFEIMEAALYHPDRVEIRTESWQAGKNYPILGFWRGDVLVVLGMRRPSSPAVIAAYASAKLEADVHRVEHVGGGGSKAKGGLPSSPREVIKRLTSMGAECYWDGLSNAAVPVTYKGNDMGKISVGIINKEQCRSDYQRVLRKMHSVNQREGSRR